VIMNLEY